MPSNEALKLLSELTRNPELVSSVNWEKLKQDEPDLNIDKIQSDLVSEYHDKIFAGIPTPTIAEVDLTKPLALPPANVEQNLGIEQPSPLVPRAMVQYGAEMLRPHTTRPMTVEESVNRPPSQRWLDPEALFAGFGSGFTKASTGGYVKANVPKAQSSPIGESLGELVGMVVGVKGIQKGVESVSAVKNLITRVKGINPILGNAVEGAIVGGTYGGARKPEEYESRLRNTLMDAGFFSALGGIGGFKEARIRKTENDFKKAVDDFKKEYYGKPALEVKPEYDVRDIAYDKLTSEQQQSVTQATWEAMKPKSRAEFLDVPLTQDMIVGKEGAYEYSTVRPTKIRPESPAGYDAMKKDLAQAESEVSGRLKKSAPQGAFMRGAENVSRETLPTKPAPTVASEVAPVKQSLQVEPATNKFQQVNIENIPPDLEINIEVIREKTGTIIKGKDKAVNAIKEIDSRIDRYKKLWECLKS